MTAATASPQWSVKVFSTHADYIERPQDGKRLPEGWEPLSIHAVGGNVYHIHARKLETPRVR